ncbi:3,4-dihydroxy-2-butanone-4-phosphate synthase [Ilyomonas limi]|nr:3,4-dihydroxy-2-butanone-4-phosphate synthase [Ilyomonas limi]
MKKTTVLKIDKNGFAIPGHIFPLMVKTKGLLERHGHTEVAVDLARLAGLKSSAVLIEVLSEDDFIARMPGLRGLADRLM